MAVMALDRGRPAERSMLSGRRKRAVTVTQNFNHTGPDTASTSYSASISRIRRNIKKPEVEQH